MSSSKSIIRMPFRRTVAYTWPGTVSTTFFEQDVYPAALGSRIVAIAACYEQYRIKNLRLRGVPFISAPVHYDSSILNTTIGVVNGGHAISYEPTPIANNVTPTSILGMSEASCFDVRSPRHESKFTVPSTILKAAMPWFHTTATGTPDSDTLVQGSYAVALNNGTAIASGSEPDFILVLSGVIEFKGMIAPALAAVPKFGDYEHFRMINVPTQPSEALSDGDESFQSLMLDEQKQQNQTKIQSSVPSALARRTKGTK
jgi:hypothetical protein